LKCRAGWRTRSWAISRLLNHKGDRPYLDYQIELPKRSLNEFLRWLNRFMHGVQILKPEELAMQHRENAAALVRLYDTASP
jgi:predicted DNA-binding transcriptional regulator YafY